MSTNIVVIVNPPTNSWYKTSVFDDRLDEITPLAGKNKSSCPLGRQLTATFAPNYIFTSVSRYFIRRWSWHPIQDA